ncbi:protein of unknown function [Methylorubrum extorquens DM4]|uniref:Uncharacterized protein n=1 Tax=Methylorubrum extorquens (strain DSM 6343 / CIP 106787 / DM4) TaxID=661410 RepID=C7C846_METED|nr:hypothetical protein [Methylorubrum extorquens]CAX21976.1 protein of unknown function [Methylorubrum extorquens DM4]
MDIPVTPLRVFTYISALGLVQAAASRESYLALVEVSPVVSVCLAGHALLHPDGYPRIAIARHHPLQFSINSKIMTVHNAVAAISDCASMRPWCF